MKKNKFYKIFVVFILCCSLVGCHKDTVDEANEFGDYISITTTSKTSKSGTDNLTVSLYVYDIQGNSAKKVFSFPYTAQYSLGAVDLYENAVYFSENDDEGGDQIFRYDLNTKTKKNITNDLFAVNYIIPTKDKVFLQPVKEMKGMFL